MGKRELVALLSLSSWCLVIEVWLFLVVPCVCLQFVTVVFPDHTHLLILNEHDFSYFLTFMIYVAITIYFENGKSTDQIYFLFVYK